MKRLRTYRRNEILINYISKHRGAQNVISGENIVEYLTAQGYCIKYQSVHTLMTKIKNEYHVPICTKPRKAGYFWAETNEEIYKNIDLLQKRISALQRHIEMLKAFMIEDGGYVEKV